MKGVFLYLTINKLYSMHLFHTPAITATADNHTLTEEESKHCIRVLRLKEGSSIVLIDGKGGWYESTIIDAHPKRCKVKIESKKAEFGKANQHLHIAIAPTKNNDRTEWFLEKSTEIGLQELSLLKCDNSERRVIKKERLTKVAVSAMKQSLKAYLPTINELATFKQFIENNATFEGQKFIAHCEDSATKHLSKSYLKNENVLILIGPEGDFSLPEIDLAKANGFVEISLGKSRLRTETAGIYACTIINSLNES